MLRFRAGLNLSVMMRSGIYNHSKWSEYMVTSHKRCITYRSCSARVDNLRFLAISGKHCAPVMPNASTLCTINVPSCRYISTTTGMFCYNGAISPPDQNLSNNNGKSNPTPHSQTFDPFTNQQINSWWDAHKFKFMGAFIGIVVAWIGLENKSKVANVDRAILNGSSPNPIPIDSPVNRQTIIDEVVSCFINKKNDNKGKTSFGVILGPTGTGKTHIVTQACHQHPKGVLYCDIMNIGDIAKSLAEVAGMRTEPTLMGTLAGYFFGSPIGYYKLPDNDALAVAYAIKEIAKRSEKLKEKMGRPACLFIDGVDIIAKNDKKLFIQLVDLAKGMANKGSLRMILVSSEGHIIPLLKETSSQSRWDVMEIVDITENHAVSYLCAQGLPNELAKRIVKVAGPRVMFCYHAVRIYHEKENVEDVFDRIVAFLHLTFVSSAADAFVMGEPATAQVIQALHESEKTNSRFDPRAFLASCSDEVERAKLKGAVDALVKANALRYSKDSTLRWHNRLAHTDILQRLKLLD